MSNTPLNPSFVIIKITSPRKAPDTTTVSDDRLWYAESWSRMRAASAASHFKAKRADGPSYSMRLFERVDLRPRPPHPDHIPLGVLSSARPFKPRTIPSALKCETCIDYPIPQLSIVTTLDISKKQYWMAALPYKQHTVHICILKTLRSCLLSWPRCIGNIHQHKCP